MRSESMVVAAGRSVDEAGRQKHLRARLDSFGRMALWSRHHDNIWRENAFECGIAHRRAGITFPANFHSSVFPTLCCPGCTLFTA